MSPLARVILCLGPAAAAFWPAAAAACWEDAERRYGVSSQLLYAVARAESDLNPHAMNLSHRSRTGTYDIGLMQINSGHLHRLASIGISESDLREPCTNIMVGAWLLADVFSRHGVSWEAVGAYNAACVQLKGEACRSARSKYAWRVFRRLPGAAANASDKARSKLSASAAPHPVREQLILSARVSP